MDRSADPHKTYIIDLLSAYKVCPGEPNSIPAISRPRYVGDADWQTDLIASAIDEMATRMWAAESKLLEVEKAASNEQILGNNNQDISLSSQALVVNDKKPMATPTMSADETVALPRDAEREIITLKSQIREVSQVLKAISEGDFTQMIGIAAHDEGMMQLAKDLNSMVEYLRLLSGEFMRVTDEIGLDGRLGGQVIAPGAQGTWLSWVQSFNTMSTKLRNQVHSISLVTRAIFLGDLSKNIEVDASGELLELKNTVNQTVVQQRTMTSELGRVATEMGVQGIFGGRAIVPNVQGVWSDLVLNINTMGETFTNQVRSVLAVTKAVIGGDFTNRVQGVVQGESLDLQDSVNEVAEFLAMYTHELMRVSREIGLNGRLGERVRMRSVGGTWKGLIDAINVLVNNVSIELRRIAVATTAVARGDLTQKISGVNVSGEMLMLITTVNDMIDELAEFGRHVKRTARGVGVDGSKALANNVSSVLGIWQELRACVDEMAGNY